MINVKFEFKNNVQVDCAIYVLESLFGRLNFHVWYDDEDESEDCEE